MENKKILFLAPYPTPKNEKEGMMQRVVAVDKLFQSYDKIYLKVSNKSLRKHCVKQNNTISYELNSFIHIVMIFKLLFNANIVYSHSIYGIYNSIALFLPFFKKKIVLDVHGVVPEEQMLASKNIVRITAFKLLEYWVFHFCSKFVVVSNNMREHFIKKYHIQEEKFYLYPILSQSVFHILEKTSPNQDVEKEFIYIVYSGSASIYQNVDKMISLIANNTDNNLIKYIILTADVTIFEEKLKQFGLLNHPSILLESVSPDELLPYYQKAHYGFLLRDDNVVNQVANPTKMAEYLAANITPIVITPKIGDYVNYDYLKVEDFNENNLKPLKSLKNRILIEKIITTIDNKQFVKFLL